ncbi:MAG: bacillithiol biosynthesis deacetylase BshB1 [Chlorobi bacterium]|jgi:bacillithiol biosynthesis deacetylase BshB1|nr:bacillithiol biosynthesis deacetylase BshB1 [Chlorobiota bacterium]
MRDILAISAHPDDVELCVAGTLMKARDAGRTFAICDLTEGERGTRGTVETRRDETRRANDILGLSAGDRWNLGMPDGNIQINQENTLKVVRAIRHFRPKVLLFSWDNDRHPDHEDVNRLVRRAVFDSGLTMVETAWNGERQKPHRPERMYCFFHTYERTPDFVVDITEQIERKIQVIEAYGTQFTMPGREKDDNEPQTFISTPAFAESLLARMRHWGFMIGATYGEPFVTVHGPIKVNDLLDTV